MSLLLVRKKISKGKSSEGSKHSKRKSSDIQHDKNTSNTSFFLFGNSFVEPMVKTFSYHKDYVIKYFYAKSMKGLTKNNNKNRKEILYKIHKKISSKTKCVVFCFGYVDVIMSYYHNKYVSKKNYNINEIIKNYVLFIKNIKLPNPNTKKIIVNFFNTSISNQYIYILKVLISISMDINDFEKISDENIKNDFSVDFMMNKYIEDSEYLHNQCKLYNIEYLSLFEDMTVNHKFKNIYKPHNIFNHHYRWDTFLKLFVEKINECGCNIQLTDKNKHDIIKHYDIYKKKYKIHYTDKNSYKNSLKYYKKILVRIYNRWNRIHLENKKM